MPTSWKGKEVITCCRLEFVSRDESDVGVRSQGQRFAFRLSTCRRAGPGSSPGACSSTRHRDRPRGIDIVTIRFGPKQNAISGFRTPSATERRDVFQCGGKRIASGRSTHEFVHSISADLHDVSAGWKRLDLCSDHTNPARGKAVNDTGLGGPAKV